jgi:RecB family exonuclease
MSGKGPIKAWSFSRWKKYEECPRRAKYTMIDKMTEPSSPALERGTALHFLCETYLKAPRAKVISLELMKISNELKRLRRAKAITEAEFAYREDWSKTTWKDWNGVWVRIKADAVVPPSKKNPIAEVIDFKSGKVREENDSEYMLQLELYALAALLDYPDAESVKTSLVFIDHGNIVQSPEEYKQTDVPNLKKRWEMRVKKMLDDTRFKPSPGNACRWCPFKKSSGGPCEY